MHRHLIPTLLALLLLALLTAGCGSAARPSGGTAVPAATRTIHLPPKTDRTFRLGAIIGGDTVVCDGGGGGAGVPDKPGEGVGSSEGIVVEVGMDSRVHVSCPPPARTGPGPYS